MDARTFLLAQSTVVFGAGLVAFYASKAVPTFMLWERPTAEVTAVGQLNVLLGGALVAASALLCSLAGAAEGRPAVMKTANAANLTLAVTFLYAILRSADTTFKSVVNPIFLQLGAAYFLLVTMGGFFITHGDDMVNALVGTPAGAKPTVASAVGAAGGAGAVPTSAKAKKAT